MEKTSVNIIIAGVGGQGTLLASRVIGNTAIQLGYDVKVSEVHGMSQRGGSVVTYVKFSDAKVASPVITEGNADFVLAFESLEAYRMMGFVKPGGKLIASTQQINPMPVITGTATYPENIFCKLQAKGIDLITVDALSLAIAAGNQKAVNTVLIGVLAKQSSIAKESWLESLHTTVPAKLLEVNLKAFEAGYAL